MLSRARYCLGMLVTCISVSAISLVDPSFAFGNAEPPPKRVERPQNVAQGDFQVSIKHAGPKEFAPNVKAKIIIPRSCLPDNEVAAAQLNGLMNIASSESDRTDTPAYGTILAGLALSCGAVSLMFLLRGRSKTRLSAMVILCVAGLLGGWSLAQADIPVPGRRPSGGKPQPVIPASKDTISIEIVEQGDKVTLILPAKP